MMKVSGCNRSIPIILVTFTIFHCIAGCHRAVSEASGGYVTNVSPQLQKMFNNAKLVCFGRFVIKIPEHAKVAYGPTRIDSDISYFEGEAGNIDKYISMRMKEIDQEREFFDENDLKNLPLFGKVIDGVRANQKIVIGSTDRIGYTLLSLTPVQGHLFAQTVGGGLPEYNFIERVNKVANSLRLRNGNEIPVDPGNCIEGGFVTGQYEYERATIGIRFDEFPDVHLSIDAHKNLKFLSRDGDPKTLHERAKKSAEAAGLSAVFSEGKILREQTRQIEHWTGKEMAFRTPAFKRAASVHEFRFHSVGSVNDPFHPQLDIRLDSGVRDNAKGAAPPSITDEDALALWDMLLKTIRLREPGDATLRKADKVPLDTRASTGETCPESGWWEAAEKYTAVNDSRRFLRVGDAMPHASTVRERGVWERMLGKGPLKGVTTWTLVAYEDNDSPSPVTTKVGSVSEAPNGDGEKHA